jgi:hypothetical protein
MIAVSLLLETLLILQSASKIYEVGSTYFPFGVVSGIVVGTEQENRESTAQCSCSKCLGIDIKDKCPQFQKWPCTAGSSM